MTNIFKTQQYILNSKVWTIDETVFNSLFTCFLVVGVKSRVFLGFALLQTPIDAQIILELYQLLLQNFGPPKFIHSDQKPVYSSSLIRQFVDQHDILLSTTGEVPHTNQVVESTL
uniref:Integrase catalytic domain-containing protein n=1 Tax=Caulerpa verticillata TaxID=177082 RepID=A0A386B0C5_9CHLO|nr:hypothetical protein [Caulerpa verticillata]AYC65141.1 hypothetical protein [Caulerpa verticillata]